MTPYVIGLDLGSSALKAVLASVETGVVAVAERGYPMHRAHPGWAENDPEDWVTAAAAAVPLLLRRGEVDAESVAAVCIVGQRDIVALIDGAGSVLGPCIHWSDRRDPDGVQRLFDRIGRERLLDVSGTPATPGLVLPNLVWTAAHRPELFTRAIAALSPKDYVTYRLTGEIATDFTTPTRSLLNDWRSGGWSEELCAAAEIPRAILPDVRYAPWETRAVLDDRAAIIGLRAGTVLAGGGGDDPSAVLGCGVTEPGELSIGSSSSTSWRVVATHPTVSTDSPLGVLPHVVPERYLHEMVAMGTGTSLRWFRDAIAPAGSSQRSYADLLAEAAEVAPGAEGLLFYPYIEGGTVPYADDHVRAAFLGIEPHHTQAHLARAITEGIAYQYPALLEVIARAGHQIGSITISDGEARSSTWNQIKADVIGRPMRVAAVPEAPAVGAAILAGMATGAFQRAEDGVAALTQPAVLVAPDPDAHLRYTAHRRRWEAARPAVFSISHVLAAQPDTALSPA
jgi:xylulokinase